MLQIRTHSICFRFRKLTLRCFETRKINSKKHGISSSSFHLWFVQRHGKTIGTNPWRHWPAKPGGCVAYINCGSWYRIFFWYLRNQPMHSRNNKTWATSGEEVSWQYLHWYEHVNFILATNWSNRVCVITFMSMSHLQKVKKNVLQIPRNKIWSLQAQLQHLQLIPNKVSWGPRCTKPYPGTP